MFQEKAKTKDTYAKYCCRNCPWTGADPWHGVDAQQWQAAVAAVACFDSEKAPSVVGKYTINHIKNCVIQNGMAQFLIWFLIIINKLLIPFKNSYRLFNPSQSYFVVRLTYRLTCAYNWSKFHQNSCIMILNSLHSNIFNVYCF